MNMSMWQVASGHSTLSLCYSRIFDNPQMKYSYCERNNLRLSIHPHFCSRLVPAHGRQRPAFLFNPIIIDFFYEASLSRSQEEKLKRHLQCPMECNNFSQFQFNLYFLFYSYNLLYTLSEHLY